MRVKVAPDDLEPGMVVAIHDVPNPREWEEDEYTAAVLANRRAQLLNCAGYPYRVVAVELPYIALAGAIQVPQMMNGVPVVQPVWFLDTRAVTLMRMSESFVTSIVQHYLPRAMGMPAQTAPVATQPETRNDA